jgi:hypothetical protein
MKNFCKFVGLMGALALGTTIASAASAADSIHVNIPFSFVVAGKVFPAGQYTVQQTDSGVILVQGNKTSAIALSYPAAPAKGESVPALHFTASNGQEYLAAVDGYSMTRAVPVHAVETRTLSLSK